MLVNIEPIASLQRARTSGTSSSFQEKGLARRAEGHQYLPNDNGDAARKRRLKQQARKEEKDSRKIVIATCGPAGLLHTPSPAEVAGILQVHEQRPASLIGIGTPVPPPKWTGNGRVIGVDPGKGDDHTARVDHVDLGQAHGIRWE